MEQENYNLNDLKYAEFARAKFWWMLSNSAILVITILGFIANVSVKYAPIAATISAILISFSFVSQWISDNAKDRADWILRQFDMQNGIGWSIDRKELCNLLTQMPTDIRDKIESPEGQKYFDSKKAVSQHRLVDNTMQSAFYSKNQSYFISNVILLISSIIGLLTIFTIIVALQTVNNPNGQLLSYFLLTAFQAIIGTGYMRLAISYRQFGNASEKVEDRAAVLLKDTNLNQDEAIKLVHDYQIARACSPLLPEWIWKLKGEEYNQLWERFRNGK